MLYQPPAALSVRLLTLNKRQSHVSGVTRILAIVRPSTAQIIYIYIYKPVVDVARDAQCCVHTRRSLDKAIHSLSLEIYGLRGNPARTTRPISARVTCYMSDLLWRMLARASVIGRMHFGANEYAVSLDR